MYLHHPKKLWFLVILAQWLTYFWSLTFWKSRVRRNVFLFSLSQIISLGQEMKIQFPGVSAICAKIWWEMKWWVNTQNCLIAQLILRRKKSDCYKNETLTADTITSQAYSNCKQTLTKITTIVENFRMNKLGVEKGRKPCRIFSTTLIQRPYYFFIVILWTACVGRA